MKEVSVDYINPFLMSASSVLSSMCGLNVKMGKPYMTNASYEDETVTITIGITGEMKGQTILVFPMPVACFIASKMMMMPVTELTDIPRSAISELGNMVMGNAATIFSTKNIGIDITPPVMLIGKMMEISSSHTKSITVPMQLDENNSMEINIAIKMD